MYNLRLIAFPIIFVIFVTRTGSVVNGMDPLWKNEQKFWIECIEKCVANYMCCILKVFYPYI